MFVGLRLGNVRGGPPAAVIEMVVIIIIVNVRTTASVPLEPCLAAPRYAACLCATRGDADIVRGTTQIVPPLSLPSLQATWAE